MTVRPFDWRDLPILLRHRNDGVFFDTAQLLTRGTALTPTEVMLLYLTPSMGIFTYLYQSDAAPSLIGQVVHFSGLTLARLSFLTPKAALTSAGLTALLERMMITVGERGALRLLAEVEEHSPAFELLRRAGFAIYARQRIWQVSGETGKNAAYSSWQVAKEQDTLAVRSLYNNLVPGLVQQVELPLGDRLRGMVYRQEGEIVAYLEIRVGARGIWIQPFIHPDAEEPVTSLSGLLQNMSSNRSRPVYLCVRSYQSWLEAALEEWEAQAGPLQAVMVKHLAIAHRPVRSFVLRKVEGGQPEPTTPFASSENHHSL